MGKRKDEITAQKRNDYKSIDREHVSIGWELLVNSILALLGISLGGRWGRSKSILQRMYMRALSKGASGKAVFSLFMKQFIGVMAILLGIFICLAIHKKVKSSKPIVETDSGVTTFYPGPFTKPVTLKREDVSKIEYSLRKGFPPPDRFMELKFHMKNGKCNKLRITDDKKYFNAIDSFLRKYVCNKVVQI